MPSAFCLAWVPFLGALPLAACTSDNAKAAKAKDAAVASDATVTDAKQGSGDSGLSADAAAQARDALSARIARGEYLVEHVAACPDCHTPRTNGVPDSARHLGGVDCFLDVDPNPKLGCLSSPNLTSHSTGLAQRSDQQIKDMFLSGRRPDGTALHPAMPYWAFGNMTGADADAIVAYLRTVPGVDHRSAPSQSPFVALKTPTARFPINKVPMPDPKRPDYASAMNGRYLAANIGSCLACHTPQSAAGVALPDKAFEGGRLFLASQLGIPGDVYPEAIYASNLTPDATGIGDFSAQDIISVLTQGVDDQGVAICPPMPVGPLGAFGGLTGSDAVDIANFLLSLPPKASPVPAECAPLSTGDAGTSDAGG